MTTTTLSRPRGQSAVQVTFHGYKKCLKAVPDIDPDRAGMNAFSLPTTEPPSLQSPTPAMAPVTPLQSLDTVVSDDRYTFLTSLDTVFLIDDSGSMTGRYWRETAKALEAITPIHVAHNAGGIDIHCPNKKDNAWYHNIISFATASDISSAVRPRGGGGTSSGQRLSQIRIINEDNEGLRKGVNLKTRIRSPLHSKSTSSGNGVRDFGFIRCHVACMGGDWSKLHRNNRRSNKSCSPSIHG